MTNKHCTKCNKPLSTRNTLHEGNRLFLICSYCNAKHEMLSTGKHKLDILDSK